LLRGPLFCFLRFLFEADIMKNHMLSYNIYSLLAVCNNGC
jgi:hypothetical protein